MPEAEDGLSERSVHFGEGSEALALAGGGERTAVAALVYCCCARQWRGKWGSD